MAILRAEVPVTEEILMSNHTVYDSVSTTYTLQHGDLTGTIESHTYGYGYRLTLLTRDPDNAAVTIAPDSRWRDDAGRELIIRTVAARTGAIALSRYILPNDLELQEQTYEISPDATREISCGVPLPRLTSVSATFEKYFPDWRQQQFLNSNHFDITNIVWVPRDDQGTMNTHDIFDPWSE